MVQFSEDTSSDIVRGTAAPGRKPPAACSRAVVRHLHRPDPRDAADPGGLAAGDRIPDRCRPCQRRATARNGCCCPICSAFGAGRGDQFARGRRAPRPIPCAAPSTAPMPHAIRSAPTSRSTASASRLRSPAAFRISTGSRSRARRSRPGRPMPGTLRKPAAGSAAGIQSARRLPPDAGGRFHYRTIKPAATACRMTGRSENCSGRQGYPLRRPAHLHFMIKAPGFETITTHIYDGSDPHLAEDAIFGVKPELVGDFERRDRGGKRAWPLDFTFVMARARNGRRAHEPHFIYSGSPAHIVFGEGAERGSPANGSKSSAAPALVLSTPQQEADAEALAAGSAALAAGVFAGAVMHTPVEVTEAAMEAFAEQRRRLRRFARRRLDHRAWQGDRLSHGPAADRDSDHLCRLGSDRHPRPDRGRRKTTLRDAEDPARDGHLRSRADARPAGRR